MQILPEPLLFRLQRLSALILAPMVIIHLLVIVIASWSGLSAAAILARIEAAPLLWGGFYLGFVAAASVHAGIGVRGLIREYSPLKGLALDVLGLAVALGLGGLGVRAVLALTGGPP